MFSTERKQKIMEILNDSPAVKVSELSNLFEVSEVTIRRDLQELEEAGMLRRTHGGAINIATASFEPTLIEKEEQYHEEKEAISRAALSLIEEDDTVFLDAGSTTLRVARQLKRNHQCKLTVITNALNIAWELAYADHIDLILTGGQVRNNTLSSIGPITEHTLDNIFADKVLLGINSIDLERGLSTPNMYEAQIKRMMVHSGSQVIVLADHSKFGRVSMGMICPLKEVDCVITDQGLSPEYRGQIRDLGVKVILAE